MVSLQHFRLKRQRKTNGLKRMRRDKLLFPFIQVDSYFKYVCIRPPFGRGLAMWLQLFWAHQRFQIPSFFGSWPIIFLANVARFHPD